MLIQQWKSICADYSAIDLNDTFQFIQAHSQTLVDEFYKDIMQEKEASYFLSDDMVQNRLKITLNQWLIDCFNVPLQHNFIEIVEKQLMVGKVHARIGIPSWLIMRGIGEIEKKVFLLQTEQTQENRLTIAAYIVQILGFASEIMCRSYEVNLEKNNDTKQHIFTPFIQRKSCELLSFFSIFGIQNNVPKLQNPLLQVVNCFHFSVSLGYKTTKIDF